MIGKLIPIILTSFLVLTGAFSGDYSLKEIIYVGTYDGRDSQGLYIFEFDRKTGQMNKLQTVNNRESPNFQVLHPDGTFLYSVSYEPFSKSTQSGTIESYRINQKTGMLTKISEQSSRGEMNLLHFGGHPVKP